MPARAANKSQSRSCREQGFGRAVSNIAVHMHGSAVGTKLTSISYCYQPVLGIATPTGEARAPIQLEDCSEAHIAMHARQLQQISGSRSSYRGTQCGKIAFKPRRPS